MWIATTVPLPTLLFAAFAAIAVAGCGIHIDLDDAARRDADETVSVTDLRRVEITARNGVVEMRKDPAAERQGMACTDSGSIDAEYAATT